MKNFVIANKETLVIVHRYEAEAKQLFGGDWGSSQVVHMEVPEELDPDTIECVENDGDYVLQVNDLLLAAKAEKLENEKTKQEIGAIVKEIYAEMEMVYNSADDIGNIATYLTYLDMLANPDEYLLPEIGLIDRKTVIGYADSELTKIRQYSKFRLVKVAQIKTKREKKKDGK